MYRYINHNPEGKPEEFHQAWSGDALWRVPAHRKPLDHAHLGKSIGETRKEHVEKTMGKFLSDSELGLGDAGCFFYGLFQSLRNQSPKLRIVTIP